MANMIDFSVHVIQLTMIMLIVYFFLCIYSNTNAQEPHSAIMKTIVLSLFLFICNKESTFYSIIFYYYQQSCRSVRRLILLVGPIFNIMYTGVENCETSLSLHNNYMIYHGSSETGGPGR